MTMETSHPILPNEARRLKALHSYRILDTAPEQAFDDFVFLASTICQTPLATLTFVDADRQWFKARIGIDHVESARRGSFCTHTITSPETLVVEDATRDERFATSPLVTDDPHIRFYAGAPLIDAEGEALGSLCALDRVPRTLGKEQQKALEALARRVVSQMQLRRISLEMAEVLTELKTLQGLLPICAYCKNIRDDSGYWQQIEEYIQKHSDADFTHGICPGCFEKHYLGGKNANA